MGKPLVGQLWGHHWLANLGTQYWLANMGTPLVGQYVATNFDKFSNKFCKVQG